MDILIAGAGPAGSSFAYFAAKQGFRVTVVDSGTMETLWSKPCGNAISKGNVPLSLDRPKGDALKQEVDTMRLHFPRHNSYIDVKGAGGYIIDRNIFGRGVLSDAISEGAEFLEKTTVTGPIIEDGKVTGVTARVRGHNAKIHAKLVVDATGNIAAVKSKLPPEWPVSERPKHFMLAYRAIAEVKEIKEPTVNEFYMDRDMAPKSYWWFFPEGGNTANIGLGTPPDQQETLMKNFDRIMAKFEVKRIINKGGALIPVSRPPLSLVGPGILVLGDAAPTVDPMTGGGINHTIDAAEVTASKLKQVSEDWSYESLWSMNEYLRKGGSHIAAMDMVKLYYWKHGFDEEFSIDELRTMVSVLSKGPVIERIKNGLKALMNSKSREVGFKFLKVKRHFMKHPRKPDGIGKWAQELEQIYNSLSF